MAVSLSTAGDIAVVRLDEPLETAHAELREALRRLREARAVVLTGHWACRPDIRGLVRMTTAQHREAAAAFHALLSDVAHHPAPTVAAITDRAVGHAAELALACRHRVLAAGGELGHFTGGRVVLGRRTTAEQALRLGLVDRVVPAGQVLPTAIELANECKPPQIQRKSCRIVAT